MNKWLPIVLIVAASTAHAAGYHLLKKIAVPGDYGWDYAATDTDGRRLYVGHDEEVTVIDIDRDRVVGRIGGGSDMHGAAIAREFGRGFISESNPGSVVIFDLKTLQKISEVPVGKDPNLIMVDHKTGRVFTADRGDKQVSAIDAKTGKVIGTVGPFDGRTEHGASDENGHMFLNLQDKGLLLRIDTQALKVLDTWNVAPCGQPSAMDMDKSNERVFIGCRSGAFAAVDGNTGKVITTLPIGPGVDALEFDPATRRIYVSSGGDGGSLSIFHEDTPDTYSLVEKVATEAGARTLAVDHMTGRVYLPVGQFASPPAGQRGRGPMVPGSFHVLVFGE
ncbi:MAG: YVTN family beta-propeller domain-containing protein [Acidobacteria bacterium]|nr:MAG: YVTN family beta-propeller domain-containing protein [Acidobacteriota bacterium]